MMYGMFSARSLLFALVLLAMVTAPGAAQTIQLTPSEINFETEVGAPDPAPQTFRVTTEPSGLSFDVRVKTGIISTPFVDPFPTAATSPDDVSVSIDTEFFSQPGTRTAEIEVTLRESGVKAIVKVEINVLPAGTAPSVSVAPAQVNFSVPAPGFTPPAQQFVVTNGGGGILNYAVAVAYNASEPSGWLSVSPADGTVTFGNQAHQIAVTSTAGLEEGDYTAQVMINSEGATNAPFSIPVTLTVGAAPTISVTPTAFSFFASEGGVLPEIQELTVRNEGGGDLVYQLETDQEWLRVTPMDGDASATPVVHRVLPDIEDLTQGTYLGNLIISSDAIGNPISIPVTLNIGPPSRLFTLPSSVDFLGAAGQPITERRLISVVNTPLSPGEWSARVEPNHINWLRVTPEEGEVPGHITLSVDTTGLAAATLDAEVVLTGRQTAPAATEEGVEQDVAEVRIPVRLTLVTASTALGATPSSLLFEAVSGEGTVVERVLQVDNNGGPLLQWDGAVEMDGGGSWLAMNPRSGTAPTRVRVSANVSGLAPGVRHGRILLEAGDQKTTVPVTFVIRERESSLETSESSIYWETVENGPELAPRTLRVLNRGIGTAAWSARVLETTGGASWLQMSPSSGTARPADTGAASTLTLTPNASRLEPGTYGALVEVTGSANDVPWLVSAMLKVSAEGTPALRTVRPGGLLFIGDSADIPSQEVRIHRNLPGTMNFQAAAEETSGAMWIDVEPAVGQSNPAGVATLTVSANASGLLPSIYRGQTSLTFGDGLVESVWATIVVPPPGSTTCRATAMAIAPMSPHMGFLAIAGRAVPIEVELVDNCGRPLTAGAVTASFNNGDRALTLDHVGQGRYTATWAPGNAGSQANISLMAVSGALNDRFTIQGSVEGSQTPRLSVGGVVNGAGFAPGRALSPGAITSVFGRGFAGANLEAATIPLPTELGDAAVRMGGQEAPLYFASLGQVNLQAPYELGAATTTQAVAKVGVDYTVPGELAVASASPGLFVFPAAGGRERAIVQNQDGGLNGTANPARRGEVVVLYLDGIGRTDAAAATGDAAPSAEPLARATLPFAVTIGGEPAEAIFLGLTPGFVGLAQANFFIPEDAPLGDEVEVVVTVDGQPSNVLVMSVAEAQ